MAHNRYRSNQPSGENRVVDSEIELLSAAGVEVITLIEESDEIDTNLAAMANAAVGPVFAPRGVRRLRELIHDFRPDVLHLHNVFPLISPWSIRVARSAGIPVVQTVHNYRHTCVAGLHLREGRICEDCRFEWLPWSAVRHGCYRGSRAQTALMAIGQVAHRPTWRLVDRFLVTSPQMEERLVGEGIDRARIEWRPTSAEDLGAADMPSEGPVVFVGRLEHAKGVELLLDSWTSSVAAKWGRLLIAGDGPLAGLVRDRAARDSSVEWRGVLDAIAVRTLMRGSRLVALPSIWFEGFPRVAAEAMSVGRPLLIWEGAGFRRVAECGAAWMLPASPFAWEQRLISLSDQELREAGTRARNFYESCCSPQVAIEQLMGTYSKVTRR